ncbi:MAG: multidrug efflux SMR transporter [Pseudomonadota bacterium]
MANLAWGALFLAGLFEVLWVIGMKHSDGFSKAGPTLFTIGCMIVSFGLLSWSLKHVPLGTAYAVWVGIGALGVAIFGMLWLGESQHWVRIACMLLIISGVIGLKLSDSG